MGGKGKNRAKLRKGFAAPGEPTNVTDNPAPDNSFDTSILQPVESGYEGSQKKVIGVGVPFQDEEGKGFGSEGAVELTDKFNEFEGRETEADTEASATEETTEQTQETDEIQSHTDTSTEKEDTGEIDGEYASESQPDEKSGDTTVPHALFHEEREKRKALRTEVDELKAQNAEILKSYQTLAEKSDKDGEEYGELDDVQKRLVDDNKALKARIDKIDNESAMTKQQREKEEINTRVKKLDTTLEEEGFPGFALMQGAVADEIQKLIMADPENGFMGTDPVSWSKIFKTVVFPKVQGKFDIKNRTEKNNGKNELKPRANLVSTPGKKSAEAKEEDKPWTYADYEKDVMARQLW